MEEPCSYDDLLSLQRKEKKDLLAKTQKMKHSIAKGDKKKKKEVTAEIAQLLADLELKHEEQLKLYEGQNAENPDTTDNGCIEQAIADENIKNNSTKEETDIVETLDEDNEAEAPNTAAKVSKAQKRRNKKAQQRKEREIAIASQAEENLFGLRHVESLKIKKILSDRGLAIYEIPSDGNCLYQAIVHQLTIFNLEKRTVPSLREEAAKYLRLHKEDYLPFITHPETGDMLTDEQFEKYCDDIVNTPAWGGHVEIKILSNICCKPIEVIQADGPSVIVGEENSDPRLIISYHRHVYGLGEHYNSVLPADKSSDNATDMP